MTAHKDDENPVFLERGDGLGWTLNFNNKWSYVVLILFICAVISVIIWAGSQKS